MASVSAMTATDSSWAIEISIWSLNSSTEMPDDFFGETFFVGSTTTGAAGVTVNAADTATKLRVQWSAATLIKIATNSWTLIGDISA